LAGRGDRKLEERVDRAVVEAIPDGLQRYLSAKLPQVQDVQIGPVTRSPGGSSRAMYFFDAEWTGAAPLAKTLALRLDESSTFKEPEISLLKEFRVYRALARTAVPVIENYWYEDDPSWFGQPFVIRERVDGVHTNIDDATPAQRQEVLERFVEIIAAQHSLDWRELGLDFLGVPQSPESFPEELLDKWVRVFRRDQVWPDPVTAAGIARLRRALPKRVAKTVLLQGQVGPNQILWRDGVVLASLDWESAMLGDPMSDLAYFSLACRPLVGDEFVDHLLERYSGLTGTPVERESFAFYLGFQTLWASTVATTSINHFVNRETPRLEPLRASVVRTRPFMRRFVEFVTGE
jgi:aminoglycoside phosphotransferase (APT) family kinase protein